MNKLDFIVRPIREDEWELGIQLAWDTFLIFEAPEYSAKGIQNFRDFVRDPQLKQKYINGEYPMYGAFIDKEMIGVLGVRNTDHISLLFVDAKYHNCGVASALVRNIFAIARERYRLEQMTVNSSPYAVEFYHKMGFEDLSNEIVTDGIRFTPMRAEIR